MSEAKKQAGKAKAAPATQEDENICGYRRFEDETVVYIGPDIPGAKQYTTYNAGLPDALKGQIIEHRVFESLVIPVAKLAKAMAELAREGSALNTLYQKASKMIQGRGDKGWPTTME